MGIRASCLYDCKKVVQFHRFYFKTRLKIFNILISIVFFVGAFAFTIIAIYGNIDREMKISGSCMVAFVIFLLFYYFCYPKIQYNSNKATKDQIEEFFFEEERIKITAKSVAQESSAELLYSGIWRIYEIDDAIYIFINPNQAHIVDKATIVGGSASELCLFLETKVGAKLYKRKLKKKRT